MSAIITYDANNSAETMKIADLPEDEAERLRALLTYDVLDTDEEQAFDELTELASLICSKPIALVSLIDDKRQWFKSHHGLDARETDRDYAFCAHTILGEEIFEVCDSSKDSRFVDNPLATGEPNVVFYAGAPLTTSEGYNLGTLCVIDNKPGKLTEIQKRQLTLISKQVIAQLELRKTSAVKTDLLKELQKTANNVQSQNQELYQFSHRVAHDLISPLRHIQSFIQLAEEDLDQGETDEVFTKLEHILLASNKARELIHDLMDLTRAELQEQRRSNIDFKSLIEDVVKNVENVVELNGVEINYEIKGEHSFISEKARLQQILYNLVSNSVKYSDKNKKIKRVNIAIEITASELIIKVEDNGLGIVEKYQHKIFEPFSRFHSEAAVGNGLGTAIIKKHVDSLNGKITLFSDAGITRFTINVPNLQD